MKECKTCRGSKIINSMGGMKEKCKACKGTGKEKVEPVLHVEKKQARKKAENKKELI
jgi:DnaJ-class molecular chaperone